VGLLYAVAVVTVSTVCCSDTAWACNGHTRHIAPAKVAAQSGGGATSTPWCNPSPKRRCNDSSTSQRSPKRCAALSRIHSARHVASDASQTSQKKLPVRTRAMPYKRDRDTQCNTPSQSEQCSRGVTACCASPLLCCPHVASHRATHTWHTAYDTHLACIMQRTLLPRCKAQRNMHVPSQRALACRMQCNALQLPAIGSPLQTQIEQIRSSLERSHCLGAHACAMAAAGLGSPVPHCSRVHYGGTTRKRSACCGAADAMQYVARLHRSVLFPLTSLCAYPRS
jgi:hypothetical protein